MTQTLNILIKKDADVSDIVRCFDVFFDCKVSTMERPNGESIFFLHCFEYSEGFRKAAFLSWNGRVDEFDELSLGRHVARYFGTEIMFEPHEVKLPVGLEFLLIDAGGVSYAADYLELEDGVDFLPGSLILI
ncbi:hypothetical protein KV580_28585 [Pseudomonas chlororaphis]|nr:hypothetical protein [Pseudomonas chlororaphis]